MNNNEDQNAKIIDEEYSRYIEGKTNDDLHDILSHIDRRQCPAKFNSLILEMGRRKLISNDLDIDDLDDIRENRAFSEMAGCKKIILIIILAWSMFIGVVALMKYCFS